MKYFNASRVSFSRVQRTQDNESLQSTGIQANSLELSFRKPVATFVYIDNV